MSDVDVIVLDLDGGAMTDACLASIERQTLRPANVIVFDNGSRTPHPRATHRSPTNLGFAGGINAAVQHAVSPFVAVINNDVVLDPDWLATVRAAMTDGVAAVQAILLREDGTIDGAGIDVSDGTIRQIGYGERTPHSELEPRTSNLKPPELEVRGSSFEFRGKSAFGISAAAALFRRDVLHFDERFFAYYEDVELSARLREEGWQLVVLPVVKGTHRGSQSAARLGSRARYLRTRNRYFVARLHPGTARIGALLREDAKLLLRGRSSLRGIIAGLCSRL